MNEDIKGLGEKKTTADNASIQSMAALSKAAGSTEEKPENKTCAGSEKNDKQQKISFDFNEALSQTFSVLGVVASRKYGDHWVFSADECSMLGDAWGQYLDSVVKIDESPLAMALGITAIVVTPRAVLTVNHLRNVESGADGIEVAGGGSGNESKKPA